MKFLSDKEWEKLCNYKQTLEDERNEIIRLNEKYYQKKIDELNQELLEKNIKIIDLININNMLVNRCIENESKKHNK